MANRGELRSNIIKAFSNTVQPEKVALVRGRSLEASMIKHFFSPRSWTQLDSSVLEDYDSRADLSAVIFFLSPEGMAYYMPSILLFTIERPNSSGLLVDALCSKFKEGKGAFMPTCYTKEQQQAISETLAFFAQTYQRDEDFIPIVTEARATWLGLVAASN